MKAREARKIAGSAEETFDASPYLEVIYKNIQAATENGEYCLVNPYGDTRMPRPRIENQNKIWKHLETGGYRVDHISPATTIIYW